MKAKFAGRCSNCGGRIHAGEEIVRLGGGWQHDRGDGNGCPADPPDGLTVFASLAEVIEEAEYLAYSHDMGDRG